LAVAALNRGQPVVDEGRSPLALAFEAFARELSGAKVAAEQPAAAKAPGLLGRLTGRR
jgi:septum formation inhibitor-activating ATPase MinD